MADRFIKDELFIRQALEKVDEGVARSIVHQSHFDDGCGYEIDEEAKSLLMVAVMVYDNIYNGDLDQFIEKVKSITNKSEARELIDQIKSIIEIKNKEPS